MTARYFPGRAAGGDDQPARSGELRAVTLLEVAIEELSAKSRSGPALGKLDSEAHGGGSTYVVLSNGADA